MTIGDNGAGIWDSSSAPNTKPTNPTGPKNALSMFSDNAVTVSDFHGGQATGVSGQGSGPSGGLSPDQGSGPPNQPSPNASLLNTSGTLSPDQGSGPPNQPTPQQNILNTVGNGKAARARAPYLGGTEHGVQIQ